MVVTVRKTSKTKTKRLRLTFSIDDNRLADIDFSLSLIGLVSSMVAGDFYSVCFLLDPKINIEIIKMDIIPHR